MAIQFSSRRWDDIRSAHGAWWDRTLERPLINLTLTGAPTEMKMPENYVSQSMWRYPQDTPVESILLNDLYTVSTQRFAADAFPMALPDYGAGVNSSFCGCQAVPGDDTVWFMPPRPDINPEELHLVHMPESVSYNRLRSYFEKSGDVFESRAIIGMTHLNNGIDIVARFFDGEDMIFALHDYPEEVKRLINESFHLFIRYLEEFSACMGNVPGYSCWSNLYCTKPWMCTQSDFSYMIGPDDFVEFILPELELCWQAFPEANFYHLDGAGQLRHLDAILASPNIKCVQWVPGAGAAPPKEWPEVHQKIAKAGKNIWYNGKLEDLEQVAESIGTTKGLYWQGYMPWERREEAFAILKRLGVPTM